MIISTLMNRLKRAANSCGRIIQRTVTSALSLGFSELPTPKTKPRAKTASTCTRANIAIGLSAHTTFIMFALSDTIGRAMNESINRCLPITYLTSIDDPPAELPPASSPSAQDLGFYQAPPSLDEHLINQQLACEAYWYPDTSAMITFYAALPYYALYLAGCAALGICNGIYSEAFATTDTHANPPQVDTFIGPPPMPIRFTTN